MKVVFPAESGAPLRSRKQVLSLIVPLMIENLLNSLMGTADTMMVTRAGSAAISAVSLVDSLNVMLFYIFSAMATGGSIICAQYIGAGNKKDANEAARQLLIGVLVISSLVGIVCGFLRAPILRLIFGSVETAVMENAKIYLLITAISFPFIAIYNAGAAMFRVDGNGKLPLMISMAANIINIVGNAVLIFVLRLGVAGAALSTLASRVFSSVLVMCFLRRDKQAIVIRDYHIRPQWPMLVRIMKIGVPTGVENGMFQFGKLVIQSTVSTMGTVAIAAQAMAAMLEGFTAMASMGAGLGLMTVVGQCIGANRPREARDHIIKISLFAAGITAFLCVVTALLVKPITRWSGMETEAARLAIHMTYIICAVKTLPWVFGFMPSYGMRGAGDVRFSMIVSTLTMWLGRVLVAVVLARVFHMGPMAVWIGMFVDWSVRGVIFTTRFISGKWATKKVV